MWTFNTEFLSLALFVSLCIDHSLTTRTSELREEKDHFVLLTAMSPALRTVAWYLERIRQMKGLLDK